jgi:site-specific DNA-methyltransferase (adenine-specific)
MEIDMIYRDDCLNFLPSIPDGSMDLAFADPPFNIGKAYGDRRKDYRDWCAAWISECFRVLKPTGSFYCMTITRHLEWKLPLMAARGIFISLISWRNVTASHDKRRFWAEYQPIMVYGKTDRYIFNTYAQTQDEGKRRWGGYTTGFRGQMKDRWSDITFVYAGSIRHPEAIMEPGTNRKANPCQMPVGLVQRAILFSTNPGGVVLDPFMGVGTTAIACLNTDRHYVGIEINPEYCRLAEERIEESRGRMPQAIS